MTAPQTGFEVTGDWTPLSDEAAFLGQIAADTAATVSTIGQSTDGHPVYRTDLGQGTRNTILIVSLIHGNELASREAALMQLRDMAYSTDPATVDFLSEHRVVWITNASPDRFPNDRYNGNGADPNRDFFKLAQVETRNIVSTIRAVNPTMIVDCHEYFATGADWMGSGEPLPCISESLSALQAQCYFEVDAVVKAAGYTSEPYSPQHIPRAALSSIAGVFHAVALLSETNARHGDPAVRVPVQRTVMDTLVDWYGQHSAECAEASRLSRQWASSTVQAYPLARMEHLGRETYPLVHAAGYKVTGAIPQTHLDLFGIRQEGTFVPLEQPSRGAIPQILDPRSMDMVVSGEQVPRPVPTSRLLSMKVHPPGVGSAYPVIRARTNQGGQEYTVPLPQPEV